jgi:hypothetical protein
MFLKHADPILKVMAEQWKGQQAIQYEQQRSGGVYNALDNFMKRS